MIYVLGSGPAGVACAWALVGQGLEVTLLDAGVELEPQRQATLDALCRIEVDDWDELALQSIRGDASQLASELPLKLAYGSDYPYRETDRFLPLRARGVGARQSLAKGGLSNVWGASVLPYRAEDLGDWPVSLEDLAPHYRSVLSFMPLAAARDDLADLLPLYSEHHLPLRPSAQAAALLQDLRSNRDDLEAQGFRFGSARLAVQAEPADGERGCVYCGLCMHGCPTGAIYSSASTLSQLQKRSNFHYVQDVVVERLSESSGVVTIAARSRITQEEMEFDASRVYVACGVLSSSRLLLESLEAHGRPVTLLDAQHFMLPWLRYEGVEDPGGERLNTLAQVFLELSDRSLGPSGVHLQVYTYNDAYLAALRGMVGPLATQRSPVVRALLARTLVIQGYLDSSVSSRIKLTLERESGAGPHELVLEPELNPNSKPIIKKVVSRLRRSRKLFRAIPASPLIRVGIPGAGSHCGGSFPMRESPGEFECDRLGRPTGFERVHVVDSTVFPSIPATTIALSAMANAHRIGSAYGET